MTKDTLKAEKFSEKVYKIPANSNCYLILFENPILIDTGRAVYKEEVRKAISLVIPPEKIKKVIFTHLHFDHIGNFDIFSNAEFFASKEEIDDFLKNPFGAILDEEMVEKFKVKLNPISKIQHLDIYHTPGHTRGSICLYYKKERILFSGDTYFGKGIYGRTDLPTSVPEEMEGSLEIIRKINYKKLMSGHDYSRD